MIIKAKLKCHSVTALVDCEIVNLKPVTGDSEENKTFSKWTPNGDISLTITNPTAFGVFIPGCEYLMDLTPV